MVLFHVFSEYRTHSFFWLILRRRTVSFIMSANTHTEYVFEDFLPHPAYAARRTVSLRMLGEGV
jgi:hypothetical protein